MKKLYKLERFKDKEEWLNKRGLGGTSASAIIGANPWKSNIELYFDILGINKGTKTKSNESMTFGTKLEPLIRKEFAYDFPQFSVWTPKHNAMFRRTDKPYITATVDGTLRDRNTGKKYILEIKTHDYRNSEDELNWGNKPPLHYLIQVLHYLMVLNDYDGAVICARCRSINYFNENGKQTTGVEYKYYWIERDDPEVQKWIEYLWNAETRFMEYNIAKHIPPETFKIKIGEDNNMDVKEINIVRFENSPAYYVNNFDDANETIVKAIENAHIDRVITTDDEFKAYKKSRAEINKLQKAIKERRLELNNSILGEVNAQLKILEKTLEDADSAMKKQVDAYKAKQEEGESFVLKPNLEKPTLYVLTVSSYNARAINDIKTKIEKLIGENSEVAIEIKEIK